jgi:hypothetical protein
MLAPRNTPLAIKGLGPSVATPTAGITAHVVIFRSVVEMQQKAHLIPGKIVLLNSKFESFDHNEPLQMMVGIQSLSLSLSLSLLSLSLYCMCVYVCCWL